MSEENVMIKDSVALVTGANRGLGRCFVEALLARGAKKVYGAARDPSSITVPGVVPLRLDVTVPETVEALAEETKDLTLLVNNAGIQRSGALLSEGAVDRARAEMETNYLGPLAVTSALAPALAANGGGAILNVLSVLSWITLPSATTYSASKAAAWALTNGLRNELAGQKTKLAGLHVGFIDTDMTRNLPVAKTSPEEVVRRGLDALEAGEDEVLIDGLSRSVKDGLSSGVYLHPVAL